MLEAGLIVSRFLHYSATIFLFGATLYPLYGYASAQPKAFMRSLRRWLSAAAFLSVLSLIGWFLFLAAIMADDADAMFDSSVLLTIVATMGFGKLWLMRLGLAVLLVLLITRWPNGAALRWSALVSALLLVSLAITGHAQDPEHPYMAIHYLADGAHLLAAGAWLGALFPLAITLGAAQTTEQSHELLIRFSWMGQLAVGILLVSGLVNSWFLLGSVAQLASTSYGRLLCLKVGLFLAMFALAVLNRFWITPAFATPLTIGASASLHKRIRRQILAEQALGLLVLGIVSWLGTLQPPIAS